MAPGYQWTSFDSAAEGAMDLVLARHGQAEWNVEHAGGPDTPLTELGLRQAARLGAWLAGHYTFTAFYASPLLRARQTAEAINLHLELPILYDDDLREAHLHYREELPRPARPVMGLGAPPVLCLRYTALYRRVSRAVRRIVGREPTGVVLVVAHSGTIGTFVRTLLGAHAVSIGTDLAATHHLRWANGRWFVAFLNRTDYLAGLE